ncbi:MAG: prephenate dehydrogenase/arogenate dehydrogenase family protein [Alphaproteobacteria bacterium]|nr:prephenate dehydrogenase/arogenate dehydrogenase family protein [Alphaproteobacteria bacterium]
MQLRRVAIIGLGLIGGSLARALRAYLPEVVIAVADPDPAARVQAHAQRAADLLFDNAAEAAHGAELVVLCTPIPALEACARAIGPVLERGAIVTDVASVKGAAITAIAPHLPPHAALVPGHPIAGGEKGGFGASRQELFVGKKIVLTPDDPHQAAVASVALLWRTLGGQVDYMPAALHDRVYACVSHLPQYLAFIVSDMDEVIKREPEEASFRRFTRLCAANRGLWSGIFQANKLNLSIVIEAYFKMVRQIIAELGHVQKYKPDTLACTVLFPYVVASCLAAVTAAEEHKLGFPLKPYAGGGFVDFTAPLASPAEPMLELISAHAGVLLPLLEDFAARLAISQ